MARVVCIVGRPGVGKSTVRRMLAAQLGWDALSIDGEKARGGSWQTLIARAAGLTEPTLIESVLLPAAYRQGARGPRRRPAGGRVLGTRAQAAAVRAPARAARVVPGPLLATGSAGASDRRTHTASHRSSHGWGSRL